MKEVSSNQIWQCDALKKKTDERVCRQKKKCSRKLDCDWGHSPFETEESRYIDPSLIPLPMLLRYRGEREYGHG